MVGTEHGRDVVRPRPGDRRQTQWWRSESHDRNNLPDATKPGKLRRLPTAAARSLFVGRPDEATGASGSHVPRQATRGPDLLRHGGLAANDGRDRRGPPPPPGGVPWMWPRPWSVRRGPRRAGLPRTVTPPSPRRPAAERLALTVEETAAGSLMVINHMQAAPWSASRPLRKRGPSIPRTSSCTRSGGARCQAFGCAARIRGSRVVIPLGNGASRSRARPSLPVCGLRIVPRRLRAHRLLADDRRTRQLATRPCAGDLCAALATGRSCAAHRVQREPLVGRRKP